MSEPAPPQDSRTTHITAGPGGVMTDEVGVITGDLTLRTELAADGQVTVRVQYRDAAEWYVVTGGRVTLDRPRRPGRRPRARGGAAGPPPGLTAPRQVDWSSSRLRHSTSSGVATIVRSWSRVAVW